AERIERLDVPLRRAYIPARVRARHGARGTARARGVECALRELLQRPVRVLLGDAELPEELFSLGEQHAQERRRVMRRGVICGAGPRRDAQRPRAERAHQALQLALELRVTFERDRALRQLRGAAA